MNGRFTTPGLARGLAPPPAADGDLVDLRRLLGIARRQFRAAALCHPRRPRPRRRLPRHRDAALHLHHHPLHQPAHAPRRAAHRRRGPGRRGQHVRQRDRHPALREDRLRRVRRHRPGLARRPAVAARRAQGALPPRPRRQPRGPAAAQARPPARQLRGRAPRRRLPARALLHLPLARAGRGDPRRLPPGLPRRPDRKAEEPPPPRSSPASQPASTISASASPTRPRPPTRSAGGRPRPGGLRRPGGPGGGLRRRDQPAPPPPAGGPPARRGARRRGARGEPGPRARLRQRPERRPRAPFIAPTPRKPRITRVAESTRQPSAVSTQPIAPTTKPPAITGTRPMRSMRRPAGNAASAAAVMRMAGPRPRIDSIPVTRTSVIVATATASCRTPERVTRQSASRIVFTLICRDVATGRFNQPRTSVAVRRYDHRDVTGSSGTDRAERAARSAADPQNLIWVMPAEEGVSRRARGGGGRRGSPRSRCCALRAARRSRDRG